MASPDTGDKRERERYRVQYGRQVRHGNGVLGAWLIVTVLIGLGVWGIYVAVVSFDTWDLFEGPSLKAHGGKASSKPWAALVGLVCLLPAAWGALRVRRGLLLILAGFIVLYVVSLQALWRLSPTIWGPERFTYSAADAGETRCWKQVPGLVDLPGGAVYGMGSASPRDVWAVGENTEMGRSLTVHWDGTTLRNVKSPGKAALSDVSAVSPTDVWAAGGERTTLVEHWNGTRWRVVATPHLRSALFGGIAAQSGKDVWAVGGVGDSPLIEHWDGRRWTVTLRGGSLGYLTDVTARSSNDAWAVGQHAGRTLIQHWNGQAWRRSVGTRADVRGTLTDVVALSAKNAWAVGNTSPPQKALIEHWDGRRWQVMRGVSRGHRSFLRNISALSPTDVWASGETDTDSSPAPLLEHWNGRRWKAAPVPKLSGVAGFSALVAVAPSEIWGAVNETGGFFTPDIPLVERSSCST
jgi:hypothetical protein